MPKTGTKEKFEKLETIVTELENADIDIDKALKLYKEGVGLVCDLGGKLKEVKKEIGLLKEKMDGVFEIQPFEEDEEEYDYESDE